MITIQSFVQDLIQQLEDAVVQFDALTVDACNEIADNAVTILAKNAPYDPAEDNGTIPGEEGHLNESFVAIQAISTGEGQAETFVETTEPIKLSYVSEGTLEQAPIVPISKQALNWPDAEHPVASVAGQDPNPFVQDSYDEIDAKVPEIVQGVFQPALDMLGLP